MPKYLIRQRRRWYAVLEIPKALRPRVGKTRFKESLETESLTTAQRLVHTKIATWKALIETIKTGSNNLEVRKAEFLLIAEQDRKAGLSAAEVRDLALDVVIAHRHSDPLIEEVYNSTLGNWITLAEHIDLWIASLDSAPKTKDMSRADALRFSKKFKYAHDATNKNVAAWVNLDLIADKKLSEATCRRIISACRNYWQWLERHKDLEVPKPFDEVVPRKKSSSSRRPTKPKRKAFSLEDFHKLQVKALSGDQQLADLIQLGGYTGARIEEMCSLKILDVQSDRMIIQNSKTAAGVREIPIHKDIKRLVGRLKTESTDGYLLSGLTNNKYGDKSNAIGKRFGRLKTEQGYGKEHVFHSLRKMLATALENAGIPENVSARLLGHELGTMSYGLYSDGVSFEILKGAMDQVDLRDSKF